MNLKELYGKVAADPQLQKELMETVGAAEEEGKAAALLAFGKKYGCEATEEEVKEFFESMNAGSGSKELSEDELDAVDGGKASDFSIVVSIISVGIVCGAMSALTEVQQEGGCKDFFTE